MERGVVGLGFWGCVINWALWGCFGMFWGTFSGMFNWALLEEWKESQELVTEKRRLFRNIVCAWF